MAIQQPGTAPLTVEQRRDHIYARFEAMASPCELLFHSQQLSRVKELAQQACQTTLAIEQKYSRYRQDNLMSRINQSNGQTIAIDDETYRLLVFADNCYQLSDGMFDITSGVLRKAWKFDGSDRLPDDDAVTQLLPFIGWQHVRFTPQAVCLPSGFELDFGGIGKEYAVDKVAKQLAEQAADMSVLVNFGGDIQITRPRPDQQCWQVGIDDPQQHAQAVKVIPIFHGGLATSGDAMRFLYKDGKRYSHILNPKTGYPISQAPRSVTVIADHCIQAGLLSTLALLHGADAEDFLQQQQVQYWCYR